MTIARFLCFLALGGAVFAQTFQVTSKLGRKFYSQPDTKGAVTEAQKNLAADPKNPALLEGTPILNEFLTAAWERAAR